MITLIILLLIFTCLFGIAFRLTGAVLKACLWLVVLFPIGLVLSVFGLALCCTIILIPVGVGLLKMGVKVMVV